jgi:hypothetical protein
MTDNVSKRLDDMISQERLEDVASGTGKKARAARHRLRRKVNSNRDTCPQGHGYTDENTLHNARGSRMCLKCLRDRRVYPDRTSTGKDNINGREIIKLDDISPQ